MKKHITSFNSFVNEGKVTEGVQEFTTDSRFTDEKSLKSDILKNAGPALVKLLKDNNINYGPISAIESRGNRIEFESKPLTGDSLGIMQFGFLNVWINTFGGGQMPQVKVGESFEFTPYIIFDLHYSYQHGSKTVGPQGSNGCSLYLPGERRSTIVYDIVKAEFLTNSQAERGKVWG